MILKLFLCTLGLLKMFLYKLMNWKALHVSGRMYVYPSVHFQIDKNSNVSINKNFSIRRNCEINVRKGASVEIGEKVFFNSGCIITAHKQIVIGNNVEFGPNVLVFDHDHKFKEGYKAKEFESDGIKIGNNVWIGAGTIILKGTMIGDNAVIAAGSIIKGVIPNGKLVIQKRNTEMREMG